MNRRRVAAALVGVTVALASIVVPLGKDVAEALTVDGTIEAPSNVCPVSQPDGFSVDWDAPLDGSITGYVVEYRPVGGVDVQTLTVGVGTSAHVTAAPGVNYAVQVASLKGDARSNWGSRCLVQWGRGPGASVPQRVPTGALANRSIVSLSANRFASCGISSLGALVCWDGAGTPVLVTSPDLAATDTKKVVVGAAHACAITNAGRLVCWGANEHGQLGDGTITTRTAPVAVTIGGLATVAVTDVALTDHGTCTLTADLRVLCWGTIDGRSMTVPTAITGGDFATHKLKRVVAAGETACVVASGPYTMLTNQLVCWGSNTSGQISLGGPPSILVPTTNDQGRLFTSSITTYAVSARHGCVAANQIRVLCWGAPDGGATGQVTDVPTVASTVPIIDGVGLGSIVTGDDFSCVALSSGYPTYCWGNGSATDDASADSSTTPTAVVGGAFMGGTADLLGGGGDTVVARWNGVVTPALAPSRPHLSSVGNDSGNVVTVSWVAPESLGAASAVTTRVEWSTDGTTWQVGAAAATGSTVDLTIPSPSYVHVRVRSESPYGASQWDTAAVAMKAVGTTTARFTLATPSQAPLVGASVEVYPSGSVTPLVGTTDAAGSLTLLNVPLGRVSVRANGGTVGGPVTLASSVFDVFVPDGPVVDGAVPIQVPLPSAPTAATRTLTINNFAGGPVPNVHLGYNGGLAPSISVDLGLPGLDRRVTWARVGAQFPSVTNAAGAAKVIGLATESFADDVNIRYDDARSHVRSATSLFDDTTLVLKEALAVQLDLPSPMPVVGASGVQIRAVVRDGYGRAVATTVSLVSTTGATSVGWSGCASKTSAAVNGTSVALRLCPNKSGSWRVTTPAAAPSTTFTVTVMPAPTQISAGGSHTCARLADATVSCTGRNDTLQVGAGAPPTVFTPRRVPGLSGVASVSAGGDFTCALFTPGSNGRVKCWGNGASGRLGRGTTTTSGVPAFVTSAGTTPLTGVSSLSSGNASACVVISPGVNGTVRCWGDNRAGQLGDGTVTSRSRPVVVKTTATTVLRGVVQVSVGDVHACALLVGGAVRCWGANQIGQLGNGTTTWSRYAVGVTGINGSTSKAASISVGSAHACARITNGTLRCWGGNASRSLAAGSAYTGPFYTTPLLVKVSDTTPLAGVTQVDVGNGHTCAITGTGTAARLWCWGISSNGQVGIGVQYAVHWATRVTASALNGISSVSASGHTIALVPSTVRPPAVVYGWGGWTNYGMLGDGTATQRLSPALAGGF